MKEFNPLRTHHISRRPRQVKGVDMGKSTTKKYSRGRGRGGGGHPANVSTRLSEVIYGQYDLWWIGFQKSAVRRREEWWSERSEILISGLKFQLKHTNAEKRKVHTVLALIKKIKNDMHRTILSEKREVQRYLKQVFFLLPVSYAPTFHFKSWHFTLKAKMRDRCLRREWEPFWPGLKLHPFAMRNRSGKRYERRRRRHSFQWRTNCIQVISVLTMMRE